MFLHLNFDNNKTNYLQYNISLYNNGRTKDLKVLRMKITHQYDDESDHTPSLYV